MRLYIPALLLALCTGNFLQANSLTWDRTKVDLEMTPEQEVIGAEFTVTNNGKDAVRISKINSSCGCTGSIIDRKILNSGESTAITATFNKGKRQGLNRSRLEVYIDGEEKAIATLSMNIKIPKLVEAMPQLIYWSPSGTKTARQIKIALDKRYVNKITKIEFDEDRLEVIEEEDPQGKVSRILSVKPKSFDFAYRGTITVFAKGPDEQEAEARIHAILQP
ncbi:MAG: DUF1573 domain-containing protein [Verrucomicrobiota bacterium]